MVEFVSSYENCAGHEYSPLMSGHGAVYGSSSCGKTTLIMKLCENGMFADCKTIVFLNGKSSACFTDRFQQLMRVRWGTFVYVKTLNSEAELSSQIKKIEDMFCSHRIREYAKFNEKPPDQVDDRPGREFGNLKIIIDDLHNEVVGSELLAQKFQSIRHSGISLLFVTQTFKNTGRHDLIKENLSFVILFKLSQNKTTLKSYLSDPSLKSASGARLKSDEYRSSLEYIYDKMVKNTDTVLTFEPEQTNHLYIGITKHGARKVSDVRSAISDPNRQVCFRENSCNSVDILFVMRTEPLTYENRMNLTVKMKVFSQPHMNKFLDQYKVRNDIKDAADGIFSVAADVENNDNSSRLSIENGKENNLTEEMDSKSELFNNDNNKKNRFDKEKCNDKDEVDNGGCDSDSFTECDSDDSMFYEPRQQLKSRRHKKFGVDHRRSKPYDRLNQQTRRRRNNDVIIKKAAKKQRYIESSDSSNSDDDKYKVGFRRRSSPQDEYDDEVDYDRQGGKITNSKEKTTKWGWGRQHYYHPTKQRNNFRRQQQEDGSSSSSDSDDNNANTSYYRRTTFDKSRGATTSSRRPIQRDRFSINQQQQQQRRRGRFTKF